MRVLVCGGRDYADADAVWCALFRLHVARGVSVLIHNGSDGAEALAVAWAEHMGVPVEACSGGARPDGVVAFPGSADAASRAEAVGLNVWKPYG